RMVQHLVEENLDAVGMSGSDQFLKFLEAAEVFVYSVVVHRAVAMIVLRRSVVVVIDGVQPERGHAEFAQIRQVGANPAQVSPVVRARFAAIVRAGRLRGSVEIGRASCRERGGSLVLL